MSPREPSFFRFAMNVLTFLALLVVLALGVFWYALRQGMSLPSIISPVASVTKRGSTLAPNQVLLYYTRDGRSLTANVADINASNLTPNEKASRILEALLAGRQTAFLQNPVPPDTKLLSAFVNDKVVVANLSKEFLTGLGAGHDAEVLAVFSVVNSLLLNMEGVDGVQILIEGEKLPTLRGTVDIESPLIANAGLVIGA